MKAKRLKERRRRRQEIRSEIGYVKCVGGEVGAGVVVVLQNGVKGGEKCGKGNISPTLKYVSIGLFSGAAERWLGHGRSAVVHQ